MTKLRSLYPGHSVVAFQDIDLLSFPGVLVAPVAPSEHIKMYYYFAIARQAGESVGVLVRNVRFGSFRIAWAVSVFLEACVDWSALNLICAQQYDFLLYTTTVST